MRHLSALLCSAAGIALPALLVASAGHAAPEAPAKAAPAAAKAAEAPAGKVVGPPAVAWKDLTPEQKGKFMKEVITPKMKKTFQAFDADEFKEFGCKTCHGKDPKAVKFKMPNPEIAVLPATPEKFQAKMKAKASWPKWVKFMHEEVQAQMADMLALPSFDPAKPVKDAFSCQNCHTLEKS